MPDLSLTQWLMAVLAALGIGVSKSGFAGVGLFHVVVFASLFGAKASTGTVLPMLIVGDLIAVVAFRQHARWNYIVRILPPTLAGVVIGWMLMYQLDERLYRPIIGAIILFLAGLQIARMWRPHWFADVPHAWWFAWSMGLLAGFTTMLANAAGPIMALYLLALALPKLELVGTGAWFFLIVNLAKVPFSSSLGLIDGQTLTLNLLLTPAIVLGLLGGRWLIRRVPQRLFDSLVLAFAGLAALRFLGVFDGWGGS